MFENVLKDVLYKQMVIALKRVGGFHIYSITNMYVYIFIYSIIVDITSILFHPQIKSKTHVTN